MKESIFNLFDKDDGVLVFPTETIARYYLSEYARSRKTSLLASRAIAFDSFSSLFAPHHETQKPVNRFHRMAFVSSFLESEGSNLAYFYNPMYPESQERFVPFFVSMLPDLKLKRSEFISNRRLLNDLNRLFKAYCSFLDSHGLFEPGFEEHSLDNATGLCSKYYLIAFDAEPNMQRLLEELGDVPFIEKITLSMPCDVKYKQFDNEKAELETLFTSLLSLRRCGVPMEDIILSSPDAERLRPQLERLAACYFIPLSFVSNPKAGASVPGRYLTRLYSLYLEDFSFPSLERLLLDTALPYRDEILKLNRKLIREMIDGNVVKGSREFSSREDKLFALLKGDVKEHYSTIKKLVLKAASAKDGFSLQLALHLIGEYLFGAEEFRGNPENRDIYSFIMKTLMDFSIALKETGLEVNSLFSLFISEIDRKSYVRQEKEEGIKVYTYGQDYLLDVPYHYLFAVNDENSALIDRELPFLEDYEVSERLDIDVSDALLSYYSNSGTEVWISGSVNTYEGAASAPSLFLKRGLVEKSSCSKGTTVSKRDKDAFERASCLAFDIPKGKLDKPYPRSIKLSYSSISKYINCPFSAALDRLWQLSDGDTPVSFVPAGIDHLKIGSFLHSVVETFMERFKEEIMKEESREEYKEELSAIFKEQLDSSHDADEYTKLYISSVYLPSLLSFVDKTLERLPDLRVVAIEEKLDDVLSDVPCTGFIDTVARSDGNLVLIDYKKGNADKSAKTYQLILYRELYSLLHEEADRLLYFSFQSGDYKESDDKEETKERLYDDIHATDEGYRKGIWDMTEIRKNCDNCDMKLICRRRFFIK